MTKSKSRSRKKTPWDHDEELTPTQQFLKEHYLLRYDARHPLLADTHEELLINEYIPPHCPFCESEAIVKRGLTKNRVQRYLCNICKCSFTPLTGTIFEGHKVAISEWMEYCLNLIRFLSINADSWNNRNAFSTSKYWLEKLFLTLETYQNDILLKDTVWLDETYYPVIKSKLFHKPNGSIPRGLSRNQICIGVATDGTNIVCFVEKVSKPSQSSTYETFKDHIAPGSTLVHDMEKSHSKLISELSLVSIEYDAKLLKGIDDKDNPLDPINDVHARLKRFLKAHSGFSRNDLQGYLNLFAFVTNPPSEPLEKVENLMKFAFHNPKSLHYRDQFGLDK